MARAKRNPGTAYERGMMPMRKKSSMQLNKEGLKISAEQHEQLVMYIKRLLDLGSSVRDIQIQKFQEIDREVYGYLVLDEDDAKRESDNKRGFGVKPVDVKLPLTLVRLEEAVTYMLMVLAPDEGIYSAIAPSEQQKVAKAFTRLMNEHAQYFGHYRNLGMFLFDSLKYNFGGLLTEWQEIYGNLIGTDQNTGAVNILREQLVQTGNELTAMDPYNVIYDPAVDPMKCYREGEFCSYTELRRGFWIERAGNRGDYFNVEEALSQTSGGFGGGYFRNRPIINAQDYATTAENQGHTSLRNIDYYALLGMGAGTSYKEAEVHEINYVWMQLYPTKWGLGPSKDLQVWRFTLVNGTQIVEAVPMSNAHGNLPMVISMPAEDGFVWQTKSWAEHLTPFNKFASQQLNVHQRASRKALYGMLFYDSALFPDLDSDNIDLLAGKIPFTGAAQDVDIRKRVLQLQDAPNTDRTMETIDALDNLMEKVLPTQMAPQVASLERATQYQAAATVQSANRRNLKLAKIIDSQAMTPCRHMQMYNILQYQESVDVITDEGELLTANPREFRDAKLQFNISDGLRGLDKLTLILHIKEALNAVVQSQQAIAQIDIVKLLDYWTSLIGDNTDFSQFRIKSPLDTLSPDEKNVAFQLFQQATAGANPGAGPGGPATPPTPAA